MGAAGMSGVFGWLGSSVDSVLGGAGGLVFVTLWRAVQKGGCGVLGFRVYGLRFRV